MAMPMQSNASQALARNPFLVLGLGASARTMDVERRKQKLLGLLELGHSSAKTFTTPFGEFPRDSERVREAADELLDPKRRLGWELWSVEPDADELGAALAMHYQFLAHCQDLLTGPEELDSLGQAWDQVFWGSALFARIDDQAERVNLDDPYQVADDFQDEIIEQIAGALADAPPFEIDDIESDTALRAVELFVDGRIDVIAQLAEKLGQEIDLRGHQHTLQWLDFDAAYKKLVRGRGYGIRHQVYAAVLSDISDYGVNLYDAEQYQDAQTVFSWLRDQARNVGDDETEELQQGNIQAAIEARTNAEVAYHYQGKEEMAGGSAAGWIFLKIALVVCYFLFRGSCMKSSTPDYDFQPTYTPPPITDFEVDRQLIEDLANNPPPLPDDYELGLPPATGDVTEGEIDVETEGGIEGGVLGGTLE
ncbi:MAG: hypothetical protein KJO07_03115 [Deltaproteobacteria bacterium]|nr:hypothetical protein [Deltaproteobacteria bacterium]